MQEIDLEEQVTTAVKLTRKEKLIRWAELARNHTNAFALVHLLEHWRDEKLNHPLPNTPMDLAASDPVFQAAGLQRSSAAATVNFFELKQNELHAFSCDCGGAISNTDMANRIEHLANE